MHAWTKGTVTSTILIKFLSNFVGKFCRMMWTHITLVFHSGMVVLKISSVPHTVGAFFFPPENGDSQLMKCFCPDNGQCPKKILP
jgi:hypothetical protein